MQKRVYLCLLCIPDGAASLLLFVFYFKVVCLPFRLFWRHLDEACMNTFPYPYLGGSFLLDWSEIIRLYGQGIGSLLSLFEAED